MDEGNGGLWRKRRRGGLRGGEEDGKAGWLALEVGVGMRGDGGGGEHERFLSCALQRWKTLKSNHG